MVKTLEEDLEDIKQGFIALVDERWGQYEPELFEDWLEAFLCADAEVAETRLLALMDHAPDPR